MEGNQKTSIFIDLNEVEEAYVSGGESVKIYTVSTNGSSNTTITSSASTKVSATTATIKVEAVNKGNADKVKAAKNEALEEVKKIQSKIKDKLEKKLKKFNLSI
jgi:hypothetical protein